MMSELLSLQHLQQLHGHLKCFQKIPHIEYKVIEISPEKKNHESNIHSRKA